jgi:predicted DNA-binding protein (UPF0251 family)
MPKIVLFSPRGRPGRPEDVELKVDEYEAIKLADYQGYSQSEGALAMGISRPSFGRILRSGRKIIADALVNGKIIHIRIGDVQVGVRQRNMSYDNGDSDGNASSLQEEIFRRNILKSDSKKTNQIHM